MNERRGTVDVFERALTEFYSVRLPRAASERRGRIGFTEYVITEGVCPPGLPRYCAASARELSASMIAPVARAHCFIRSFELQRLDAVAHGLRDR